MKILLFFNILFSILLGGGNTPSSSFINNLSTNSSTIGLGDLIVDSYSDMALETNIHLESRPMSSSIGPTTGREYNDPFSIIFFDMKTKDGRKIKEIINLTINITYNKPLTDYLPIPFEKNQTLTITNKDERVRHQPSIPSFKEIGSFPSLSNTTLLKNLELEMEKKHSKYLNDKALLNHHNKEFYIILPYAWDVNTVFISSCAVTVDGEIINPEPEPQPDGSTLFNLNSMNTSTTNIAITSERALLDIEVPNTNLYDGKLRIGTYDFTIEGWTSIKQDIEIKANLGANYYNVELKNGDLISLKSNFPVEVKVTLKEGKGTFANIVDNGGNLFPDIDNNENKTWINDMIDFFKQVGIKFNELFNSNLPFWLVIILIILFIALLGPMIMVLIQVFKFLGMGIKYLFIGLKWVFIGPFKLFNLLFIPKKKEQKTNYKYKK